MATSDIIIAGNTWTDVPGINVPKSGGGTSTFTDVSDSTAVAADVAQGKYFYTAQGVRTEGTSSGGGGNMQTKSVTYTSNGTATVTPDTGYDGLSQVSVTVAIPVWDGSGTIS